MPVATNADFSITSQATYSVLLVMSLRLLSRCAVQIQQMILHLEQLIVKLESCIVGTIMMKIQKKTIENKV